MTLCHNTGLTIVIPLVMGRYRDRVRDLTDDVELLNTDLIDLVENVNTRNVGPVPFDNVDKFIRSGVASDEIHQYFDTPNMHGRTEE